MADEIELKLELAPESIASFLASDLLAGDPAVSSQRSIYFDTPGRDLWAAGLSLRIRETGGQLVQTVKAAGSAAAGLFARPEWENSVADLSPAIDDRTPIRALLGAKVHDIGPVFEVHVERRIWNLYRDDSAIELVCDRGEIVAGERRTPLSEIELELKRGSPSALFSLARGIDAVAPLRVGVLSKAERGHRLLEPAARAVKAEPVVLPADTTVAAAFRHIAGACLRQFRLNEALIDRSNREAVHQARVALRRLRSAFTIHKAMLDDGVFQQMREETRWLAGALGEARDLDVLAARCDAEEVRAKLEQARADAYVQAEAALASRRARALMLDLSQWLAVGDWLERPAGRELREQLMPDFASSTLERFRRKVKKGGRDLAELDDAARHDVRKDAKKLRYAAEFFASLFDGKRRRRRYKRFLDALEALQDQLGILNDVATAEAVLARLGLEDDPAAAALLDAGKEPQSLIEAAADAHDAFADAKRFWL